MFGCSRSDFDLLFHFISVKFHYAHRLAPSDSGALQLGYVYGLPTSR